MYQIQLTNNGPILVYVYKEKYKFLHTHTVYVVYLVLSNVYLYML